MRSDRKPRAHLYTAGAVRTQPQSATKTKDSIRVKTTCIQDNVRRAAAVGSRHASGGTRYSRENQATHAPKKWVETCRARLCSLAEIHVTLDGNEHPPPKKLNPVDIWQARATTCTPENERLKNPPTQNHAITGGNKLYRQPFRAHREQEVDQIRWRRTLCSSSRGRPQRRWFVAAAFRQ